MKRKGNAGENRVRNELRARGYVVGSMRETEGEGDLVAIIDAPTPGSYVWLGARLLVEVKANVKGGPYANFRAGDRMMLKAAARRAGCLAWLAFCPPPHEPDTAGYTPTRWIPEYDWPKGRNEAATE